jgi:ribonuclease HI
MSARNERWTVCTDGGCPANPGPGAFAFVITKGDGEEVERSGFLPMATNNQAEYRAMTAALLFLQFQVLPTEIEIFSDSELIVNQLNGRYSVKSEELRPFYDEAQRALAALKQRINVSIRWFSRDENTRADDLCNQVLERRGIEIVSKKRKINFVKMAALSQS